MSDQNQGTASTGAQGAQNPQGPQPGAQPPAGANVNINVDEKTLLILLHVTTVLGPVGLVALLVIWLTKKDQSPAINAHGKAVLNFQLSLLIYYVVGIVLTFVFIGVFVIIAVMVLAVYGVIMGAMKASKGELFKYPLTIPILGHVMYHAGMCAKCGYNLAGVTGGVCPECGTPISSKV